MRSFSFFMKCVERKKEKQTDLTLLEICRPLVSSRDSVAGFTLSVHNAPKVEKISSLG